MPRWVGLLGSWALLVLGIGILGYAVAAEAITVNDASKLRKVRMIDAMIAEKRDEQLQLIQKEMSERSTRVTQLQSEVSTQDRAIEEAHDSDFVITVSTRENKVYARRNGELVFEAICSTGSNSTLTTNGRTMVFRTPIGRFRIRSREENPQWVPPDWHYIEEAQKNGLSVVRLDRGKCIDDVCASGSDVTASGGVVQSGSLIVRGGAVVIPPIGTTARRFPDVLGTHRLNLGDGYALHGTQAVRQLGQSVSHGCVRLKNEDIARLYAMAKVGDEVIIY